MSIKYKCVKNITVKAFFVDFYYGILGKTEYIIIVCKQRVMLKIIHVIFVCPYRRTAAGIWYVAYMAAAFGRHGILHICLKILGSCEDDRMVTILEEWRRLNEHGC